MLAKFFDSPGISTRAQFIYLHIAVPLRRPLAIPCLSARYLSFFSPFVWVYGYTLHILTYTCYLHIHYFNLMAGRVRPSGQRSK